MAASTTTAFPGLITAPATAPLRTRLDLRRRISPQAAHALEKLSSTIEYLAKQFLHEGGSLSAHAEELQAVEILMALQREIYFECPVVPTFSERFLSLFRPREEAHGSGKGQVRASRHAEKLARSHSNCHRTTSPFAEESDS